MDNPEISVRLVHNQIYSWNEFYAPELISNYAHGVPGAAAGFAWLARRLMVAQTFLHSDHSGRIALGLSADVRLTARHDPNPVTHGTMRAAQRKLARSLAGVGLSALTFAARPGAPGSSFHVGGSLPMARRPYGAGTDVLGRPAGLERVHVVDASVLPSIPATTITFGVMANAHRIGSLAP
jgi:choline dehydrogenase-like flavoprotein